VTWGTISVPEVPTNCTFGGPDRKTLYITAPTSIYRVTLKVPGLP
jgi:gluconolactonase